MSTLREVTKTQSHDKDDIASTTAGSSDDVSGNETLSLMISWWRR